METPIRVFTKTLDLKAEVDNYSSLQYERNFHDDGEIEIHINQHVHGGDKIEKGDIVTLGDSKEKAAIIRSKEISLDESGKESEEWTLKGTSLKGLMKQRIIVPPKDKSYDRKSGKAETVMKHYVRNHFVEPEDDKRKIDRIVIADDQERGEHVKKEERFKKPVLDVLADISKEADIGWTVYIDFTRRVFVFDVVEGLNLTQSNEDGNNPVFFSPDFGTIKSQEYTNDDSDMANFAYVGGPGEGKDRTVVEVGDKTGIERFEHFVDARDVKDEYEEDDDDYDSDEEENKRSDDEIEKDLKERGKEKLKEKETERSLEAEIVSPTTRISYEWTHDGYVHAAQPYGHYEQKEKKITPFEYEKDFDLGDKVQVYNGNWGVTLTSRITKIKEIHETDGFRIEATFGKEKPTLPSKIKDEFDDLKGIEKEEIPAQLVARQNKETNKKLSEEQKKRLEEAKETLSEAKGHTEDYAEKKVHVGDEPPEDKDKEWYDTSKSHPRIRRYNHEKDDSDDDEDDKWETTDVVDKDTTFADEWLVARHIESLNGLTVGDGQFEVDDSGNVDFAGKLKGADGEFKGTVKGGKIETAGSRNKLGEKTKLEMEGGTINGYMQKDDEDNGDDEDSDDEDPEEGNDDEEDDGEGDSDDDGDGDDDDDDDMGDDDGSGDKEGDIEFYATPSNINFNDDKLRSIIDRNLFQLRDNEGNYGRLSRTQLAFFNGNGKMGIQYFKDDDRNVMVLRSELKGKKYGSNIYLYGNNDKSLPGALRLFDGTAHEKMRLYKGYIYNYALTRIESQEAFSVKHDNAVFYVKGSGKLNFNNGSGKKIFVIRDDIGDDNEAGIQLPNADQYTSSGDVNVHITSHGNIKKTKSTRKIKKNIEDVSSESADNFLKNARPITFESIDIDEEDGGKHYGYIAEEIEEVDDRLAVYNADGEADSLEYTRISSLLHKALYDDRKRIESLEKENKKLKDNFKKIEDLLELDSDDEDD